MSIPENPRSKPITLIILDGFGIAPESNANAISKAKKPNFDKFCQEYFCTTLQASSEGVGLNYNEMGNSEVGHLNIGAGKIVYQNLPRINKSILSGEFFTNPVFLKAIEHVKKNNSKLHLMGLLSNGGVHGSIDHLYALLELAQKNECSNVFIHGFLDGRDMDYNSGLEIVRGIENQLKDLKFGKIATLSGRFWAMDRDNHWERIQPVYNLLTKAETENTSSSTIEAIEKSYEQKIYDEEFKPTLIDATGKISENDAVIFFNFRADRARQLTSVFVNKDFDKFETTKFKNLYFATMTQYEKSLPVEIAFPPETISEPLAKVISENNLKQLHIAETEKYAHVTYFINGGREEAFPNEDQVLIESPRVESYAETPDMSAPKIKDKILNELAENKYDFIVVNFANPDMVGHTGNISATVKAIETVDKCLGELVAGILSLKGVAMITADHGNAEELINLQTGEIIKEHSTNPVPFIIIGEQFKNTDVTGESIDLNLLTPSGVLADIAPTILKIMNLPQPDEMTGRSLV